MIRKTNSGYKVYSESGKPLSKTYTTKQGAQKILNKLNTLSQKNNKKALARVLFLGH